MQTAAQNGLQRLYHYQGANLDHLRDTLVNRRVHFSNPQNFNDPWDCNPYFEPAVEDAESRLKWGERLDTTYKNVPADLRARLEAGWTGNWYDHKELLRQSIEQLSGWVRQLTSERWRIYCLSRHSDSVLMWAHYAEKHKGLCLEFDARIEQVGHAYRVLYQDTFPVLGPDDIPDSSALVDNSSALLDAVLLTKSREWAYEDEYRILARDESVDPTFSLRTGKDYFQLTPGALTGIVAGCNADVDGIQAVMAEFGSDIPIKRALQSRNRYHIHVVE